MSQPDAIHQSPAIDVQPTQVHSDTLTDSPPETLTTLSVTVPSPSNDSGARCHVLKNVRMSHDDARQARQPADVLADAKRYRKRAQLAESDVEKLKIDLAGREKDILDLKQTLQMERVNHDLEARLRETGAIDMDAALALARQALEGKQDIAVSDVNQAVAELQRAKPWLFRMASSRQAAVRTGVMSAAATTDGRAFRVQRLEHAAGDAATSGSRIDLLRYLRLRRKRAN